ncbi:MAG: hypothetical protein AAGK22_01115 [Acidobacteriota bacterium]
MLVLNWTQVSGLAAQTLDDVPVRVFDPASVERVEARRTPSDLDGLFGSWAPSTSNATSPPNIGDDSYEWLNGERMPLEIVPGGLFVVDRLDPESRTLHLTDFEAIRGIAGPEYRYWGGGGGMHFLTARPEEDLWGLPNASSPPPIDHVAIFSEARRLVADLAAWSNERRSGRFVFSPFFRPLGYRDPTLPCVLQVGPPIGVGLAPGVSLARAEEIVQNEIGGQIVRATGSASIQVDVDDVADGMVLLARANQLVALPEVRWTSPVLAILGCTGGPSGGPGIGTPSAPAPFAAPSLGTLGLSLLSLLLALLGLSVMRRSL